MEDIKKCDTHSVVQSGIVYSPILFPFSPILLYVLIWSYLLVLSLDWTSGILKDKTRQIAGLAEWVGSK